MISKILVANRGEIARRIFRTCRRLGISTVAVYSDADRDSPHVAEADEAVHLPGIRAAETYLDTPALLAAAKSTGVDAIHPGYGFLSESSRFATAVTEAGLVWIGPTPEAIETMGSKLAAKRVVEQTGVPSLPTIELREQPESFDTSAELAFPILVKASAGGGGKGMRVVTEPEDLPVAVESARREAEGAFGDGTLFLEKYLDAPRHIEVQILGDNNGEIVSLYERECSIQRRHQKIIEEAPSPAVDESLRSQLGQAAIEVARSVGYLGAGTVEFLFKDGQFFFLEMNTRLQVEHPVTEMITGLDLVEAQIVIADGGRAPAPPPIRGHAIEARLYAEDPRNDFLPVTGVFHRFRFHDTPGLRVDSGIEDGSEVSVHYDPMIAKVIAHAGDREAAAALLATSLRQAQIHGSTTNRELLVRILGHPEFLSGATDTGFLVRHDPNELAAPLLDVIEERHAAIAATLADQVLERDRSRVLATFPSGWRNSPSNAHHRAYAGAHGTHDIWYWIEGETVSIRDSGRFQIRDLRPDAVSLSQDGTIREFGVARYGADRYLDSPLGPAHLIEVPRFPQASLEEEAGSLHAPMPGKVIRVEVGEGDRVIEGQVLMVLEAMKMEHTLRSPHDGVVSEIRHPVGDQVKADAVLVIVEGG